MVRFLNQFISFLIFSFLKFKEPLYKINLNIYLEEQTFLI